MISKETEAKIIRLHRAEKWPVGTIARQLGIHHSTVRRALARNGQAAARRSQRASIVDPYLPFIEQVLAKYPRLRASRLYQMVRERGYPGGPDHFRHIVALHRPKPTAEAYLRLRTLPGEQAQVDWAHFGRISVGRAERRLVAFCMVLSWSRRIFCRFYFDQRMESFLRGHEAAFDAFGGVPRVLLYDNLKSVVLERDGDAVRFHPSILDFAGHYRFEPRPVAVARGNEKGRVERAIRYIRDSFFAARRFDGLDDLNRQVDAWCEGPASDRLCPEDRSLTVRQAFTDETQRLLPIPDNPFPTDERVEVKIGKTPYARFDLNDYSVPHDRVRRTLTVVARVDIVRIFDGIELVAEHRRIYDKGVTVEDRRHIAALAEAKHEARRHRGIDRLRHAVPQTAALLEQLAERGDNIGSCVSSLLLLLDRYGSEELNIAVSEALQQGSPHPQTVRLVIERRRHERNLPPLIPVQLPDDPRVRDLVVKPHDLATYDSLNSDGDGNDER